ncbi:MAG TPA: glycosyltransferase [Rhizomicrobium sp.]|jgi:UDP:flavonoid glycosyltransferase YjiC (YdhE family)|nr:glycosyltransferase [Rhizomicrobium sp.]
MIVSILAAGTRGDVQPPAALALRLASRGHEVRLLAHSEFESLVAGSDVVFKTLPGDLRKELDSDGSKTFFASGGNPLGFVRWFMDLAKRYTAETTPLARDYCAGSDVIVSTGLMDYFGTVLGQSLRIPCVHAWMQPVEPTGDYPFPMFPPPRWPRWMNRASTRLAFNGMWLGTRPLSKLMHQILELPRPPWRNPMGARQSPNDRHLMAYSEALVPRSPEWPSNLDVTGFWFLDRPTDWTPPDALARFIKAGPAPIYIGFGSMIMKDPAATVAAVLEAIDRTKFRAVISAGWGGLRPSNLPDTVFAIDAVPHDWLFPKMAAIVHHGGAGTTGAASRAGKPQVVVPFISDQFFWADQLRKRGVAPASVPHKKLTTDKLTSTLNIALSDNAMRQRASDLGERVRAEDGTARAAETIETVRV